MGVREPFTTDNVVDKSVERFSGAWRQGNRANRVFGDGETGDPVPKEQQTKAFEIENGQYIIINPDEAATVTELNKTLEIEAFIPCSDVDDVLRQALLPDTDKMGGDAFVALRDRMRKSKVAERCRRT